MRRRVTCAVAVLSVLAFASTASAATPERFSFDQAPRADVGAPPGAARLRDRLGRFGVVSRDPSSGGPRVIAKLDGYLTPPAAGSGAGATLGFLRDNERSLGLDDSDIDALRLVRETPSPGGRRQILWQQTYRGIPSIDSQVRANLTLSNRLVNVVGPVIPDLSVDSTTPRVSARDAYAATRRGAGASGAAAVEDSGGGATRPTTFADGGKASLVIYRAGSAQRLAWRVLARVSSTELFDAVVDAETGAVVRRTNRVLFANASVFENFPGAANGGTQTTKDITAYLDPGATTLKGPNAHAFSDVDDLVPGTNPPVLTPRPEDEVEPSSGSDWLYPFTPVTNADGNCDPPGCAWDEDTALSWQANREQDVTQLFWFVNTFHDHLKASPIGFDAASGNFEGDDAILAQAMDGANTAAGLPNDAHVDNANMTTLADGFPGLMQMYLFSPPGFGAYSGADEADIVYHEYTHGLSNRLVTDATGAGALDAPQSGAMGEAWSDFYAMDFLVDQGLRTDAVGPGDVKVGDYVDHGNDLIRTEAIDCLPGSPAADCPGTAGAGTGGYTYGDLGKIVGAPEVHADGEIWVQTLWQLRQALIDAHPADGVERAERYVTDAMRLSPPNPSYLDMRNAILQASTDDDDLIWTVFASRGMGYFASTEDGFDVRPVENFDTPPAPGGPTGTVQGRVDDEAGTPQSGITVAFGGHDTGLGPDLSATTNGSGDYSIAGVPTGTYPLLRAFGIGGLADARATNVAVGSGTTTVGLRVRRDFASSASGASIASFTGPNFSGCGPAQTIDDQLGSVWSTTRPTAGNPPRELTVDLGQSIDIGEVRIDPTAGCGDDPGASLKDYEVAVGTSSTGAFTTVATGTFGAGDRNRFNSVALSGPLTGKRFVKLIAKTPQSNSGSGAQFIDVRELQVFRAIASPVATTLGVQGLSQTGATLTGTIDPKGTATSYQFEFGTSTAYGSVSPASPADAGDGFGPVAVSAPLTGLTPSTTYHYRVVAVRGPTRIPGADQSFTTTATPLPPDATTGDATGVGQTFATLTGSVATNGQPTTFHFEYGTSTAYGAQTLDTFTSGGAVSAPAGGLSPGVTYHYRLVATNAVGTTAGADRTFTTTAAPESPVPPPEPPPAAPIAITPAPAPTPAPTPPADTKVTLASARTIAVDSRRRLRTKLTFGSGLSRARGRLEALSGRTSLGRVTVTPRPGKTVTVTLTLTRDGARKLGRTGRLKVTLRASFKTAAGKSRVASRTVTLTGRRSR
jgi:hypothetical protein